MMPIPEAVAAGEAEIRRPRGQPRGELEGGSPRGPARDLARPPRDGSVVRSSRVALCPVAGMLVVGAQGTAPPRRGIECGAAGRLHICRWC